MAVASRVQRQFSPQSHRVTEKVKDRQIGVVPHAGRSENSFFPRLVPSGGVRTSRLNRQRANPPKSFLFGVLAVRQLSFRVARLRTFVGPFGSLSARRTLQFPFSVALWLCGEPCRPWSSACGITRCAGAGRSSPSTGPSQRASAACCRARVSLPCYRPVSGNRP